MVLELGNSFFKWETASPEQEAPLWAFATTIAKATKSLAPDAIIVGQRDFALGRAKLLDLLDMVGAPVLGGNVLDAKTEKPLFKDVLIVERAGKKIGLFGLVTADLGTKAAAGDSLGIKVTDPVIHAKKVFNDLKEKTDFIIAMSSLNDTEMRSVTEALPDLKFVVRSNARGIAGGKNQTFGNAVSMSVSARGKALGIITFAGKGNDYVDISARTSLKNRKTMYQSKLDRMIKSAKVDSVKELLNTYDKTSPSYKRVQRYLTKIKEIEKDLTKYVGIENYFEIDRVLLDKRVAHDPDTKIMVENVMAKYGDPGKIRRAGTFGKYGKPKGK